MTPCVIADSLQTRTLSAVSGGRLRIGGPKRLLQLFFFDAGSLRVVQIALLEPNDLLRDSHRNEQVERYALTCGNFICA